MTANVTIPENSANGTLFTQCGFTAGWALYIKYQKLVGVHNFLGIEGIERFRLMPTDSVSTGKGILLTPLSQWGKNSIPRATSPTDPAVDDKTPPLVQVSKLDGVAMLTRIAELMKRYPPHANDCPILFRMRACGLEPGEDFDPGRLDGATIAAIATFASPRIKAPSAGSSAEFGHSGRIPIRPEDLSQGKPRGGGSAPTQQEEGMTGERVWSGSLQRVLEGKTGRGCPWGNAGKEGLCSSRSW